MSNTLTRFRITDEKAWTHEFDASSADDLAAGIRAGWDAYIAAHRDHWPATHPGLALPARLAEIRAWLDVRMAREVSTADQRASWTAQAAHWRWEAEQALGGTESGELRLHVYGDAGRLWLTPTSQPVAPRVPRRIADDRATHLFDWAVRMVAHDKVLAGLCDHVGEVVRAVQYPALRAVPAEPEGRS